MRVIFHRLLKRGKKRMMRRVMKKKRMKKTLKMMDTVTMILLSHPTKTRKKVQMKKAESRMESKAPLKKFNRHKSMTLSSDRISTHTSRECEMSLFPCMFLINEFQDCGESFIPNWINRTKQHVCFHSQLCGVAVTEPARCVLTMQTDYTLGTG